MKALGGGNLIGQARTAFSWVDSLPMVSSVAMGMQNRDEVNLNVAWSEWHNIPELEHKVGSRGRQLCIDEWCTGCGSCAAVCSQAALHIEEGRAEVDRSKCILCGYCARQCPEFFIKVV
jgi:ferredoxin